MAALIGWYARPLPQADRSPVSLLELLKTDLTKSSAAASAVKAPQQAVSRVPKVPPGADHVPLEIRVGLVPESCHRLLAWSQGSVSQPAV